MKKDLGKGRGTRMTNASTYGMHPLVTRGGKKIYQIGRGAGPIRVLDIGFAYMVLHPRTEVILGMLMPIMIDFRKYMMNLKS